MIGEEHIAKRLAMATRATPAHVPSLVAWVPRDRWLWVLVLLGLVVRLVWALLPLEVYLSLLEDDAWMVTAIARNVALGHGITADGIHPTNGFHPLYPLTLGLLPYVIASNNLDWGFRANLVICAVLNVLAVLPLAAILRRYVEPWAVRCGVALVALNPYLVRLSVNAMETSLALLLLLSLAAAFVALDRRQLRNAVLLGFLAGLAVLARLDVALFVASLGLVWIWQETRLRRLPLRSATYGAVCGAVLLPYFARNLFFFGSPTPSSGRALAYLHSYAPSFTYTGGLQLVPYTSLLPLQGITSLALLLTLFAAIVLLLFGVMRRYRDARPLLVATTLYTFGLTFYYAYLQQQGNPRYYVGVSVLLVLPVILGVSWAARRLSPRLAPALAGGLVLLAVGLNTGEPFLHYASVRSSAQHSQPMMYEAARWISANLPAVTTLAARNSGIFQYYSNRVVLNIDGKLNHEIIPVLERRELMAYLRRNEIDYVVDLQDVEEYIEFYSAEYTEAPPHRELSSGDKLQIYGRMWGNKLGLPVALPRLDRFEPSRVLRRFRSDAMIVARFARPGEPDDPVAIFRITR